MFHNIPLPTQVRWTFPKGSRIHPQPSFTCPESGDGRGQNHMLAHLFPNSAWMMQYLMSEHRDQLQGLSNRIGKISALSILNSLKQSLTWQLPINRYLCFGAPQPFLSLLCIFSHSVETVPSESNKFYDIPSQKKKSGKSSLDPIYFSSYCNDLSAPLHSKISSKVFLPKLSPLSTFPIYSSASAAWLPPPSLIRNSRCQS